MTVSRSHRWTRHVLITGPVLASVFAASGCSEQWDNYALRGVQTNLPGLMEAQWSRRRDYTEAEMLAVRSGGSQTVLVARASKPAVYNDVAQLDEQVSHTFVLVLDEVRGGRTYRITAENGRVIEGTSFRPAWRPYRGLEGEVTILSDSKDAVTAAVRVTALTLRQNDPARSMSGTHRFKVAAGGEPGLRKAQINFDGGAAAEPPAGTAQ